MPHSQAEETFDLFVSVEELLGESSAVWPSPGGTRVLFAQFNDTDVEPVTLRPGSGSAGGGGGGWLGNVGNSNDKVTEHNVLNGFNEFIRLSLSMRNFSDSPRSLIQTLL
jgi:hypothetical protein